MSEILYTVLDNPTAMERLRKAGYSPARLQSIISRHRQTIETTPTDFTYHPRKARDEKPVPRIRGDIRKAAESATVRTPVQIAGPRVTSVGTNPFEVELMSNYGRMPEKSEAIKARQMKSVYGVILKRLKAQHANDADVPVLDNATMDLLHHKVQLVQPNLGKQGVNDLLAKLIEQGQSDLGKSGSRSRKFFSRRFSARNKKRSQNIGKEKNFLKEDF